MKGFSFPCQASDPSARASCSGSPAASRGWRWTLTSTGSFTGGATCRPGRLRRRCGPFKSGCQGNTGSTLTGCWCPSESIFAGPGYPGVASARWRISAPGWELQKALNIPTGGLLNLISHSDLGPGLRWQRCRLPPALGNGGPELRGSRLTLGQKFGPQGQGHGS